MKQDIALVAAYLMIGLPLRVAVASVEAIRFAKECAIVALGGCVGGCCQDCQKCQH